jgi:SAM-dependent methyltransferase
MRAILTAAGSGKRWSNYLQRRKHLIQIDGETLLDRTVRLLRERGITDIWLSHHPEYQYKLPGVQMFEAPLEASNAVARLSTRPIWHPSERTLILLGDVYFTEQALDIMVRDHGLGWTHFARLSPSKVTGKPGCEMFGCSFGPEDHDAYADALHRAGPGSDWPAYCAFVGQPVDTDPEAIQDWGHHVEIPDDGTDDFDFRDDFERFHFYRGTGPRIVRASDFFTPWFRARSAELKAHHKMHRKLWEHCSIAQAYRDRLNYGGVGLGFGVGKEPLPAWFAAQGADILATDRPDPGLWLERQHAKNALDLRWENICTKAEFERRVNFAAMDMRAIPDVHKQGQYDFTWSTSCFEHIGGIRAGLEFFMEQMKCLKPGGIALHTTEYNMHSNTSTIDGEHLCVFRQKDLLELTHRLHDQGDRLWPIDLVGGDTVQDLYVDTEPFCIEPHLKLRLAQTTFTSVLLIAARGGK